MGSRGQDRVPGVQAGLLTQVRAAGQLLLAKVRVEEKSEKQKEPNDRVTGRLGTAAGALWEWGQYRELWPEDGPIWRGYRGRKPSIPVTTTAFGSPRPRLFRRQNGGGDGSRDSAYASSDQAEEVASESVDAKDRRADDAHARSRPAQSRLPLGSPGPTMWEPKS